MRKLLEKRAQERKGVPCLRNCARVRESAEDLASALRRPVTYAHIARTRTLRDPAVLLGQSDATWLKRIFSR